MDNITNKNQSLTVYSNKGERETFNRKRKKLGHFRPKNTNYKREDETNTRIKINYYYRYMQLYEE